MIEVNSVSSLTGYSVFGFFIHGGGMPEKYDFLSWIQGNTEWVQIIILGMFLLCLPMQMCTLKDGKSFKLKVLAEASEVVF